MRGARRRVDLLVVVELDHLGGLEARRGELGEAHHEHRADGEVGGDHGVGLDGSNRARKSSMSSALNPVVPTTACTPLSAHQAMLSRAASTTVKSTATSAPASASASGVARHLQARVDPALPQVDPRVHRVDRGDELELGVVEHRVAHRGPHAPGRAEHTNSDHAAGAPDHRPPT